MKESDKIIEEGQMANDPMLEKEEGLGTGKSYMINESEDEFYTVKKKWTWKPTRLLLLWLIIQVIEVSFLTVGVFVIFNYLFMINIEEMMALGIVLLAVMFKMWWYKNENK